MSSRAGAVLSRAAPDAQGRAPPCTVPAAPCTEPPNPRPCTAAMHAAHHILSHRHLIHTPSKVAVSLLHHAPSPPEPSPMKTADSEKGSHRK
uniref:Uncharacterized protein n=1 Tax=Oryza meridionalis TaxID=40149 RepID=A0A0E0E014_9ORYZ